MFAIALLTLAAATGPVDSNAILIVQGRPSIRVGLAGYELRREQDIRELKMKIGKAANRVCVHGYGLSLYVEVVACVQGAVGNANQRLGEIVASGGFAAPLATNIAVAVPAEWGRAK